jgi:hypothetical protein
VGRVSVDVELAAVPAPPWATTPSRLRTQEAISNNPRTVSRTRIRAATRSAETTTRRASFGFLSVFFLSSTSSPLASFPREQHQRRLLRNAAEVWRKLVWRKQQLVRRSSSFVLVACWYPDSSKYVSSQRERRFFVQEQLVRSSLPLALVFLADCETRLGSSNDSSSYNNSSVSSLFFSVLFFLLTPEPRSNDDSSYGKSSSGGYEVNSNSKFVSYPLFPLLLALH